jgi:hypothetical protein
LLFGLQQQVAEGLEQREVPAHLDLQVFVSQRRAAAHHTGERLRVAEVEQAGLGQRVHRHHLAAVVLAFLQRGQHAGMVGAGVLPYDEDQLGVVDVIQRYRALADADGRVQRGAGGLVAHVGAVRQVVGAQRAGEQLVHERCLVGRAPGGVEDAAVRRAGADVLPDQLEGICPGDRRVVRLPFPDDHGFAEPALVAQPVLGLSRQLGDGMLRPELRPHGPQGVLFGHSFGAVLAEFGCLALLVRLRPRTARAVKTAALVEPQQRLRRAGHAGLRHGAFQRHHHGFDAGGFGLGLVDFELVLVDVRDGRGLLPELHCSNFLTGCFRASFDRH